MKTKISFLILFLLPFAVFAQSSPETDSVWLKKLGPDFARSAFFSKDDSKLYVNADRAVLIYEPMSGSLIREVEGVGFFLFESPDGRYIYTDSLYKLDAQTYEVIGRFPLNNALDRYCDLSLSGDGQVLIASYERYSPPDITSAERQENNIIIYNPETFQIIDSITIKKMLVKGKISPDKKHIAFITFLVVDKKSTWQVELYNFVTKLPLGSIHSVQEPFYLNDIDWSPDCKYLGLLTRGAVNVFNLHDSKRMLYAYASEFQCFSIDKKSNYIFTSGGMDGDLTKPRIYDINTEQLVYKYEHYNFTWPNFASFSNNGKLIICGNAHRIMLYNTNGFRVGIPDYEQQSKGTIFPNPVNSTALLNYNVLVSANYDIKLIDINGAFVQQVFTGFLEAGTNTINIDCTNLPAGVYYISINNREYYKLLKEY